MALANTVVDRGYRSLARPVLYRLGRGDAETAHERTLTALAWAANKPWLLARIRNLCAARRTDTRVFGLTFPGRVGLAAGADKDGQALAAWPALGFGFVEAGTVTAIAQPGNLRPRVFRLPASGAVINRMGFPNRGAAALAKQVRAAGPIGVPLGISIGKSKVTPVSAAIPDYLTSLRAVADVADYVAVNVSSPNTPGLRGLQDRGALDELLAALTAESAALAQAAGPGQRPVPLLVKIAPDLSDHAIGEVLEVCHDRGVAGVIATNTTIERPGIAVPDRQWQAAPGGLSGKPLRSRALTVVRFVTAHTDLPVIGVGGISTPDDAAAMLDSGASLVQLYTAVLYRGPALIRQINQIVSGQHSSEGSL